MRIIRFHAKLGFNISIDLIDIIKELKRKSFINFMKSIGKLGGQNKVPRLSNNDKLINQILKF